MTGAWESPAPRMSHLLPPQGWQRVPPGGQGVTQSPHSAAPQTPCDQGDHPCGDMAIGPLSEFSKSKARCGGQLGKDTVGMTTPSSGQDHPALSTPLHPPVPRAPLTLLEHSVAYHLALVGAFPEGTSHILMDTPLPAHSQLGFHFSCASLTPKNCGRPVSFF